MSNGNGPTGALAGNGNIIDNNVDEIAFRVEDSDASNKLAIVLRMDEHITWWKSLELFVRVKGGLVPVSLRKLETKNQNKEASVDIFDYEVTDQLELQFWKAGFVGLGAFVTGITIDSWANLGKKITFTWVRDTNENQ